MFFLHASHFICINGENLTLQAIFAFLYLLTEITEHQRNVTNHLSPDAYFHIEMGKGFTFMPRGVQSMHSHIPLPQFCEVKSSNLCTAIQFIPLT